MFDHADEAPKGRGSGRQGAALVLERFVSAFPGADGEASRHVVNALFELIDEGVLRPDLVEMSLVFGEDDFRIIANGGASREAADRIALTGRVLDAFGLTRPVISRIVSGWLTSPDREVFVGAAVGQRGIRTKLYLRDSSGTTSALEQATMELGVSGNVGGRFHDMIGMDFVCHAAIAVKRYDRIDWATVRRTDPEGLLVTFLTTHHGAPEGIPFFHRTIRSTTKGEVIDIQINAQFSRTVVGPAWDIAYAEYVGDPRAVGILQSVRESGPIVVRAVGATLNRETGFRVYLALPE